MQKFDVPVGTPVQYFHAGDKSNPAAAVITRINDEGIADLCVFPMYGGELIPRQIVRHEMDDWHYHNPDQTRVYGFWNFLPNPLPITEPTKTEKKSIPEPAKGRS